MQSPTPCHDCVNGLCTMNCGPAIANTPDRIGRAVDALRGPHETLARVPNTVRQSLAEVIEGQREEIAKLRASLGGVATTLEDASRRLDRVHTLLSRELRDAADRARFTLLAESPK